MKIIAQLILIVLVIVASVVGRRYLIDHAPKVPDKVVERELPWVEVVSAHHETYRLEVLAEGTVTAPARLSLAPEVAGRVLRLGKGFEEGGHLSQGDLLIAIDPADYQLALDSARAELAAAEAALRTEEVAAEVAIEDWRELNDGDPPALVSREPQIAAAKARLDAAAVAVSTAELNLARTRLSMPFDGRIVTRAVERAQRVDPSSAVAVIERSGALEVRLPLDLRAIAALDLDPSGTGAEGLEVQLEASIGEQVRHWSARGSRTAADLSPLEPVVTLIATVDHALDGGSMPVPGMFVRATILGHEVDAVAVPSAALDLEDTLLLMNEEGMLERRKVRVARARAHDLDEGMVLVTQGLADGEQVVTVRPAVFVEGMHARVAEHAEEAGR